MRDNIYIAIYCMEFDVAKKFYTENIGFEIEFDENIKYNSEKIKRLTLLHKIVKNLEIEFIRPSNKEEVDRIGANGGTINLFTIPTKNIDTLRIKLKNTAFFIDYTEAPYASFLNIEDPMGNKICLYEKY